MPRLGRHVIHDEGFLVFNLEGAVKLLAHQRDERFEGERAICLFQFQTWILFPDPDKAKYVHWAGLIAAVKLLEQMDDDHFIDEEGARLRSEGENGFVNLGDRPPQTLRRIGTLRNHSNAYRQIYDRFIGRRGGLLGLLHAPTPSEFDQAINSRIDPIHIVSELIDYQLRYIQHSSEDSKLAAEPNGANYNHAVFFCWWPTREIKSGRGKTSPNKSVSIKTMGTWWDKFEMSALFVYLIKKHGFDQLPIDTDDDSFADKLLRESKETEEIIRFLGAYAYLVETFEKANSDLAWTPVPESVARVPVLTPPFSKAELNTISQYKENHLKMRM
jgi:hypothetical protein